MAICISVWRASVFPVGGWINMCTCSWHCVTRKQTRDAICVCVCGLCSTNQMMISLDQNLSPTRLPVVRDVELNDGICSTVLACMVAVCVCVYMCVIACTRIRHFMVLPQIEISSALVIVIDIQWSDCVKFWIHSIRTVFESIGFNLFLSLIEFIYHHFEYIYFARRKPAKALYQEPQTLK